MTIDSRLFDDLTRVAGGAVSILSAVGKQLGEGLKEQMGDKFSSSSSFSAANDDVDRLQGVVTKLRLEQEDLKARIATLEAMLGASPKKSTAKKKVAAGASAKPAKKTTKVAPKKAASTKPKAKKRA